MEMREQAKKLYIKSHRHPGFDADSKEKIRISIRKMVRKFVQQVKFKGVFDKKEFRDALVQTVNNDSNVQLQKTSEAFLKLETYFLLLHDYPWKKEFHTLKMYGGFINCHICANLSGVENIFRVAGYHDTRSPGVLSLEGVSLDTSLFMDLALECVIGAEECLHLQESVSNHGISPIEALQWHSSGSTPHSLPSMPSSKPPPPPQHADRVEVHSNRNVSAGGRTFVEPAARGRGHGHDMVDLPYADDEVDLRNMPYEEGTLDEHMAASLVALRQEGGVSGSDHPSRKTSRSCLDEWNYVRNSLPPAGPHLQADPRARPMAVGQPIEDDEGIEMEQLRNFATPVAGIGVSSTGTTPASRGMAGLHNNGVDSAYATDIHFPPSNGSEVYNSGSVRSSQTGMAHGMNRPYSTAEMILRENNRLQERAVSQTRPPPHPHPHTQQLPMERDIGVVVRDRVSPVYSRNSSSWPASGVRPVPPLSVPPRPNPALTIEQVALPPSMGIHPSRNFPQCGDSRRVCQRCTYENSPTAVACAMCMEPLGKTNTQTYV